MHPMLINFLAEQVVRERSRGRDDGLSRPVGLPRDDRGARRARRGGFWLLSHPLGARRA